MQRLVNVPAIHLMGLMTIAPYSEDPEDVARTFTRLRHLRDHMEHVTGWALPELSMGMSDDFEIAIEEGATMVRIGRAIFGERRRSGARRFESERSAGILGAMPRYSAVSARAGFPEAELEILELWQRTRVFERSLAMRRDAPRTFSTRVRQLPTGCRVHHVLARSYKDVFARYKQMTGFSVARKAGWDTHGLPVELEVERALKISGKKQIEEYGIAEFNARCKASVNEYIDQWREMSERLGFWLDFDHPYRTYDGTYIESVWWSLKELWEDERLYQGYKVTPYCPRCQTTLSSHELSQGYAEDTPDPSVYVKFRPRRLRRQTFLLAWTTTPWTLPGNVALAVHSGKRYVRVAQGDKSYILAKQRLYVLEGPYEVLDEMDGADLVDTTYEPLFTDMIPEGLAFVVLDAPELVSMDEGTGVVHTAAAYGVADLELCSAWASPSAT